MRGISRGGVFFSQNSALIKHRQMADSFKVLLRLCRLRIQDSSQEMRGGSSRSESCFRRLIFDTHSPQIEIRGHLQLVHLIRPCKSSNSGGLYLHLVQGRKLISIRIPEATILSLLHLHLTIPCDIEPSPGYRRH